MKWQPPILLLTFIFFLLASSFSFGEEISLTYFNSKLGKSNLYDHFLNADMKMNLLKDAKEARIQIEKRSDKSFWPAYKYISDVSAIEFSYLLYWYSEHKKAIQEGRKPYWLTEKDLELNNIATLADNMRHNRNPGYIITGLLEIADNILREPNLLNSGDAEDFVRDLLKESLWCSRNIYSRQFPDYLTYIRSKLDKSEIYSIIDEFAKNCEKSDRNQFQVDTLRFKITKFENTTFLFITDKRKIEIPNDWLYPAGDVEKEKNSYVSSFNYLKPVTSFVIDGRTERSKLIGIHISSWDYMPPGSGSAMAASGRDIFLIYNNSTHKLSPGILDLGITKDRVRSMGCFFAIFNNFYLGDINNDGLTDIGIQKEKIWCDEVTDEQRQIDFMTGPYYKKLPIQWYAFKENTWKRLPLYDIDPGKFRTDKGGYFKLHPYTQPDVKLPMIGMKKSPVEFVREIYKGKLKEVK